MNGSADPASGAVELREDVPLKTGAGGSGGAPCCAGGPRLIIACFAALSVAITLALFTQIYYGDYELVPHGGVSSDAEACSSAGTDALKAGGRALDAAAVTALCLAVLAPHRTSFDASGSLLYWEYRQVRTQRPMLAEWGTVRVPAPAADGSADYDAQPPRLLASLAALHADHGSLPWPRVLQPAIDLAKSGFLVSEGLAAALADEEPAPGAGSLRTAPELATYLESLQHNTSAELAAAWNSASTMVLSTPAPGTAGSWRVFAGGVGAAPVHRALALALDPPPLDLDEASRRVISALQQEATSRASADATDVLEPAEAWPPAAGGVATGLAVVDSFDTYVALVTGLSVAWGSGPVAAAGWRHDAAARLDLAPAIMLDDHVCGTRYVLGGGSGAALAQVAAALAAGGGAFAVERARAGVLSGGALSAEPRLPASALPTGVTPALNATTPYAAVNVVQQQADALLSHADSRGGGLASRF